MFRRAIIAGACLAAILSWSPVASAMQPPPRHPSLMEMLRLDGADGLVADSVQVDLECRETEQVYCDVTQTYELRNETETQVEATASLVAYRVAGVDLRQNGVLSSLRQLGLPPEDDDVGLDTREFPRSARSTYGAEIGVEAGESLTVEVRARMKPRAAETGMLYGPTKTRHPLLGGNAVVDRREWAFDLQPLRSWSQAPVEFRVTRAPANWRLSASPAKGGTNDGGDVRDLRRADPNENQYGTAPAGFSVAEEDVQLVELRAGIEAPTIRHGGPYVAAGAWVDDGGFVGRFGYEVGFELEGVLGLAVDSDFEEEVSLAGTIMAATPSLFCVIPSFGLGLGPTVRLVPEAAAGLRSQAEIQFPFAGVVATLDWYPGVDGPAGGRFAVMGRVGF